MLKVKFIQFHNVLIFTVLEQDLRGDQFGSNNSFSWTNECYDTYKLASHYKPQLDAYENTLYLRGSLTDCDDIYCSYTFNSKVEADVFLHNISQCIKAYNNLYANTHNMVYKLSPIPDVSSDCQSFIVC